jgi:serine/threonine protein kinase
LGPAAWERCIALAITRLDRTVAIKVLPEALQADPEFREGFDREARSIAALNHPLEVTMKWTAGLKK